MKQSGLGSQQERSTFAFLVADCREYILDGNKHNILEAYLFSFAASRGLMASVGGGGGLLGGALVA